MTPFTSNNPLVRDDKAFDLFGVSLVTAPGFGNESVEARVVLNLDPYRVNELGQIERPMVTVDTDSGPLSVVDPSAVRTLSFSDAYKQAQSDPALATALLKIRAAVQEFINAKGY